MVPSTIRNAIWAVKDQTSIILAKLASNLAPDLEVLIVKATSHDDEPADEKYIREILNLMQYSRAYVNAFVYAISKRLSKTRDWIVALKALMLVRMLLNDGDMVFGQEIIYESRKGTRVLNMSGFCDEAHSNSWDQSGFVRTYALYLDQKLKFLVHARKLSGGEEKRRYDDGYGEFHDEHSYGMQRRSRSYDDFYGNSQGRGEDSQGQTENKVVTPVREMKPDTVLERLNQLLHLIDRFLACKPTGVAKNSRMVLVAFFLVVKESFGLYADICEVLGVVLDQFGDMKYTDCVKAFIAYVNAARMIDKLVAVYNWSKDTWWLRSSEYPEVQRIADELLRTLEESLRDRANQPKVVEKSKEESSSDIKGNN